MADAKKTHEVPGSEEFGHQMQQRLVAEMGPMQTELL